MPRKKPPGHVPKPEGRPPTIIDRKQFDQLCFMQSTLMEIAAWFECSQDTIQNKVKEKYGISFSAYYEQKACKGKASLRRLQYLAAQKGDRAMMIWLGKNWLNQRDIVEHQGSKDNPIQLNYKLESDDNKPVNPDTEEI